MAMCPYPSFNCITTISSPPNLRLYQSETARKSRDEQKRKVLLLNASTAFSLAVNNAVYLIVYMLLAAGPLSVLPSVL